MPKTIILILIKKTTNPKKRTYHINHEEK